MRGWKERWGLADREAQALLFVLFSLLLGALLWVLLRGTSPTFTLPEPSSKKQAESLPHPYPLDLNEATYEELIAIPGIGPTLADRILRLREKLGHFRKVEDLLLVKGIGPKRLKQLSPYLTVSPETARSPIP